MSGMSGMVWNRLRLEISTSRTFKSDKVHSDSASSPPPNTNKEHLTMPASAKKVHTIYTKLEDKRVSSLFSPIEFG